MHFKTTKEAIEFVEGAPDLKSLGGDQMRVMENNVRMEGGVKNFNAGKNLVKELREKEMKCPVMIFCGDLTYVKPIMEEFADVIGTTNAAEAKTFVTNF
mmetsp:Transcript_11728/g.31601  ORF Transcript_11728/g.31601 Transcript_11728/m.31601 type:complete len:99 (-) Transcript_11728:452-748(-)|eukprot:CAMPEP_0113916092 /NCGR_PEP_ID=MMETSP0780_2-20120614/31791_1 /TAXON_ID=652834 /ORGANISM="Palpitomonas bilix" /LENGTH=98 /DNA_ID=CAMNT_0000915125 /DNA_START=288 /DNA_END=584 /DNA_ORIENTATION=- /assembly_acc=CAM_ASM_000599